MLYAFYHNRVIVLCLMIAATSCSKNNNDATPSTVDSVYLPTAIYNSTGPLDSFVYNDDNTVAKIVYAYDQTGYYDARMELDYNEAGQCKRVRYFGLSASQPHQADSLVYGTNGDVVVARHFLHSNLSYNLKLKLNSDGALTSFVQDTFVNISQQNNITITYKSGNSYDITLNNGNLTQYTLHSYFLQDGQIINDNFYTYTFAYNNHANSLLEFFRKNPYIQVLLTYDQIGVLLYTASANTVSSFTRVVGSGNNLYAVTNTYDNTTNLLTNQVVMDGNAIWDFYSFQYKKRAKK